MASASMIVVVKEAREDQRKIAESEEYGDEVLTVFLEKSYPTVAGQSN
jgi:hypothetical protein